MRILIVDDEIDIQAFLKERLTMENYAVDCAMDGERGSYLGRTNEYDLIILDYHLPKKTGLVVCQELRTAEKNMPILMLTVNSEVDNKVNVLNAGADDYISKPFSYNELIARIRALLRRPPRMEHTILRVGDLTLDKTAHVVKRGRTVIRVTPKEFSLLECLMRNKGEVMSRGMIMEHVWNQESDPFSNTIEAHVMNLRKKIEGNRHRKLIHNIPGRGYKIEDGESASISL